MVNASDFEKMRHFLYYFCDVSSRMKLIYQSKNLFVIKVDWLISTLVEMHVAQKFEFEIVHCLVFQMEKFFSHRRKYPWKIFKIFSIKNRIILKLDW